MSFLRKFLNRFSLKQKIFTFVLLLACSALVSAVFGLTSLKKMTKLNSEVFKTIKPFTFIKQVEGSRLAYQIYLGEIEGNYQGPEGNPIDTENLELEWGGIEEGMSGLVGEILGNKSVFPSFDIETLEKNWDELESRSQILFETLQSNEISKEEGNKIVAEYLNFYESQIDELIESSSEQLAFFEKADASFNEAIVLEEESMYLTSVIVLLIVVILFSIFVALHYSIREVLNSSEMLKKEVQDTVEISSQLNSASSEMAAGSAEQAAAVQETVAALEEISSMINRTLTTITETVQSTDQTATQAQSGLANLDELKIAMNEIRESATELEEIKSVIGQISDKANVINDIVFKTQLLSFNASIEAARAGEHGRGFSVVAEEVGSLADMSGQAAKEISELLDNSTQVVNSIVQKVGDRSGQGEGVGRKVVEVFNGIVAEIDGIRDKAQEISSAAGEQEEGVKQTFEAMKNMDVATLELSRLTTVLENIGTKVYSQSNTLDSAVVTLNTAISGQQTSVPMEYDSDSDDPSDRPPSARVDLDADDIDLDEDFERIA